VLVLFDVPVVRGHGVRRPVIVVVVVGRPYCRPVHTGNFVKCCIFMGRAPMYEAFMCYFLRFTDQRLVTLIRSLINKLKGNISLYGTIKKVIKLMAPSPILYMRRPGSRSFMQFEEY